MKTLSIVLPCRNEEAAISSMVARLRAAKGQLKASGFLVEKVCVVDDASTDSSVARLREYPDIEVLRLASAHGYGGALKAGIRQCRSDLIAFLDLDDTYNPREFVFLCQSLVDQDVDLVCGDRLSQCQNMPLTREIGNRMFKALIQFFFRTAVADSCTGMRVFKKSRADEFTSSLLPDNLNYSLAMTLYCLRLRIPLLELPIQYQRRLGQSKLKILIDGPRFLFTIVGLAFQFWLRSRPRPSNSRTVEAT